MSLRLRLVLPLVLAFTACPAPPGDDAGIDAGATDAGADAGTSDAGSHVISPNTQGWWRGQVFYEVFVRSFFDSNNDGHGDFAGLTAKLDYLNDGNPATTTDLGVDALWLMPVYPSPSYHGYDVTEYRSVDSAYGSLAEFDALLAAAHQRGIKVILDFVANHTSSAHPWFKNARGDVSATFRDYYVWRDDNPGWRRPTDNASLWHQSGSSWYYGYFTGEMPDLNYRNPEVRAAMVEAMRFWLQRGVDGFRVDAARYLVEALDGGSQGISEQPETHAFVKAARDELHQTFPQALFVAEVWADHGTAVTYYGDGDEYQLAFDFDLAGALIDSAKAGDASALINTIARNERHFEGKDPGYDAPFLTNHDMVRVMRQLSGNRPAARLAAATLFALPGTPFVYYGEEIGMSGGASSNDQDKRTPMRWSPDGPQFGFTTRGNSWYGSSGEEVGVDVATQQADDSSLWNRYRKLIALRHAHSALATGSATRLQAPGAPASVFSFLRSSDQQRVLYVANFSSTATGAFQVSTAGQPTVLDQEALTGTPTVSGGAVQLQGLGPWGFAFLQLQ
jgi:glycosidase